MNAVAKSLGAVCVALLLELAWLYLKRKGRWAAMGKPSLAYEWPKRTGRG